MTTKPLLSVIVPTYNEKGNMQKLFAGLTGALEQHGVPHEIIVMDDCSPDGTTAEVQRLAATTFRRARVVERRGKQRGLSPAVIDGFAEAHGDVLLVMDADLSHPVEVVPLLYKAIVDHGADISVGSRHVHGGGIEHWPLHRRIISFGASAMARPLTTCTDPMSGFFALRPDVIRNAKLNAAGFKILLEILVKGTFQKMEEVPIVFKDREVGESKLTGGVMTSYIKHLIQLYLYPGSAPFFKFLAVGASGMLVDLAVFSVLLATVFRGQNTAVYAQAVSFVMALCWNYTWNSRWTFAKKQQKQQGWKPFIRFAIVSCAAFLLRSLLFSGMTKLFGITQQPGLMILLAFIIVLVTAVNFLGSKLWAFKN